MKKIILGLMLAALPAQASQYAGRLDLGKMDPSALGMRDLVNGVWRVGLQYQLWHLENTSNGREVFHVSGFWASRLEGQNTAYGPSIGVNIGPAVGAAVNRLELLVPAVNAAGWATPPWVSKLGDWTSFDGYGAWSPEAGGGDSHWVGGVGGKLRIPFTQNLMAVYDWATGTQAQGTGVKGL